MIPLLPRTNRISSHNAYPFHYSRLTIAIAVNSSHWQRTRKRRKIRDEIDQLEDAVHAIAIENAKLLSKLGAMWRTLHERQRCPQSVWEAAINGNDNS